MVTMRSALADQNEPSLSLAIATIFCGAASLIRVETLARPERGPRWKLATLGCGFFWLKMWMLLTWSLGVIGLSTATVSGTELPFSTSGGTSIVTLPSRTGASPPPSRSAAAMESGVAAAGRSATSWAAPNPPTKLPAVSRKRRRVAAVGSALSSIAPPLRYLITQRREKSHHILDLLGRQHRLAAPGRRDAGEPVHPIIGRHDRCRIDPAGIDHAQPQLARGPSRAAAGKIRREVALELLLGKRAGMAQQAETDLAVGDDRPAAQRIAGLVAQRRRDRVADHLVGTKGRPLCARRRSRDGRCAGEHHQAWRGERAQVSQRPRP